MLTRYKTVILVAVQSFIQLPSDFGRPGDPAWKERDWDGAYHKYFYGYGKDERAKGPVEYSVIMMYNVNTKQRKVVVTKGVTVNEAWVRQVMWMCGFEDEDALPGMVEEEEGDDGKGKGTKVKGRKPVGEEMLTKVWNATTEHVDPGDWQEVAAGVSRHELIREALEELRGDVEGWLSP